MHDLGVFIDLENEGVNYRNKNFTMRAAYDENIVGRCGENLNYPAEISVLTIVNPQALKLEPVKFIFWKGCQIIVGDEDFASDECFCTLDGRNSLEAKQKISFMARCFLYLMQAFLAFSPQGDFFNTIQRR